MQIAYTLEWQQPNAHYFDISIHITNTPEKTTQFSIPAWRPGRYAIQNFNKNIIGVTAASNAGTNLVINQIDKDTWEVQNGNYHNFVLHYKAYAFELDAGNSFLDDTEAYINPVTMMMYISGKESYSLTLKIIKPKDWKIASPLDIGKDGLYQVADYHTLVDSPILISPSFKLYSFKYAGAKIEIAIQGDGVYQTDSLITDLKKIVKAQTDIFAGLPFTRYVFIYHFVPQTFSHGVEHKNGTSIVVGPNDFSVKKNYQRFLGVTTHEFFHVWNVERIRPKSIYLPDYSKEEYSRLFWFFEGVTSYYKNLSLCRAGILKTQDYLNSLASSIRKMQDNPGHTITSPAMASFQSWGKHNGAPPYSSVSFYTSGAVLGLLLDLEIRHLTNNKKSLDDVMRYLYKQYAQKNKGVPEAGIRLAIEEVSGHSFLGFFRDYVQGTKKIDFNYFLKYAGLQLITETDPQKASAYLGLSVKGILNQVVRILPDSPAFNAGLDINDELVAIDGKKIKEKQIIRLLKRYQPGDSVVVTFFHHDKLSKVKVLLGSGHNNKWLIKPSASISAVQKVLFKDWLKTK